jgi:hypothetical protein
LRSGHIGPDLMDEASEDYLIGRLSELCLDMARDELMENHEEDDSDAASDGESQEGDPAKIGGVYEAKVALDSFNDVKVQFSALGLIEKGTRRRPPSDDNNYWLLTPRGTDQLMRLRAIRKPVVGETGHEESPVNG